MVVRNYSTITCDRDDNDISVKIRELKEKIAHLNTYTDTDTVMLKAELESLQEQLKLQFKTQ